MTEKVESEKHRKWSWEIFTALMFIGLGLGMIFGESSAGVILGMGVGFLLSAFVKIGRKVTIRLPRSFGGIALIIIGIGFIFLGLGILGYLPSQILQVAGGISLLGLGVLIILAGGIVLKKT